MTARSIIDVAVNDESFKAFIELFNDYRAKLADLPGDWSKVNKATEAAGDAGEGLASAAGTTASHSEDIVKNFQEMTAALMAQAEQHRRMYADERSADAKRKQERDQEAKAEKNREAAQKRYEASVNKTNANFKEMRSNITGAVSGIASAATYVLKFVGLGGIAGGLLGAGGLFGLDRLADSAGNSRRTAQGLDTSIGDLKAFSVNYQRIVDPGSYLANIETVARTPGLQYGAGGRIAQLSAQGLDTADIGAALLPYIKQTFLQNGGNATALQTSGLGNVVSLQDAIRISKLSDAEIAEIASKYQKGKASLAVNDQVAKDWQDLSVQLSNAGERIENVLIKDLDKLAPVIAHLSDEAVDLVDKWTSKLVPAIDDFATYLDSDKFKQDLKDAEDAVKKFADASLDAARFLGLIDSPAPNPATASNSDISRYNLRHPDNQLPLDPTRSPFDQRVPGEVSPNDKLPFNPLVPDSYFHHKPGTAWWESGSNDHALGATGTPGAPTDWRALHNPGDLFVPGSSSKMLGFSSDEEGIRGIDKQLQIYMERDHLDTIEKIAGKYAPPGQNDTEAYIRNLVARTGFARDQRLSDDLDTRSRLIPGITKQEHSDTAYTQSQVRVIIQNNTGGSAVVSTSQLAQ